METYGYRLNQTFIWMLEFLNHPPSCSLIDDCLPSVRTSDHNSALFSEGNLPWEMNENCLTLQIKHVRERE